LIAPESASIYRLILEKIPFIALIIPMSIITYFSVAHFGAFTSSDSYLLHMRIGNALVSYIHYLGKMSLPLSLSIYYPYIGTWPIWQVTLYGFILAAFSSFVLWKVTRYPYLAVGWLWYLGTLIPVIGLVQVGDHAMADRYTYIPLIGIFIMIAWGVPDLLSQYPYRKAVISFFSILIILLLSFLSWQRCQLWGDKVALWSDALKNHQVPFAYNIRGLDYEKRGQHQKAIEDFNHALMIKPNFAEALNNRANSYATIGQYDQAFRDYNKSLVFKPHDADTFYNRGILHLKNRHFESATGDFTEAIRIRPEMADAFNNRGTSLSAQKRYIEAIADYNTATRINPHHIQALHNLGIILMNMKKYDDAAIQFEKIMKINPADQDAMQKLNTIARLKHQP
jgi:tetratricopeptide (TPR) repeat protein